MCQSLPLECQFLVHPLSLIGISLIRFVPWVVPTVGAKLHDRQLSRKPRGVHRDVLGPEYTQRLSFCCRR